MPEVLHLVVAMAYNDGFSARELNEARRLGKAHRDAFERAWNEHFA